MEIIKAFESAVRKMFNDSNQIPYNPIKSFNNATKTDDTYVIFEGDYGSQIYLTCPMKYIKCSEQKLKDLIKYIDGVCWKDEDGCRIYYEIIRNQQSIAGGMGGGKIVDGLWIHTDLIKLKLKEKIELTIFDMDIDIKNKIDKLIKECKIVPVGDGYIDLICPTEYAELFIKEISKLNVCITEFTWWCRVRENHTPCGMGGKKDKYSDDWYSEIEMGKTYEFETNDKLLEYLLKQWTKSKEYKSCYTPAFWLCVPKEWKSND